MDSQDMSFSKGQNSKKTLRNLRRILSFEALATKGRVPSENSIDESRRMNLTQASWDKADGDGGDGKLLRLKSYPPQQPRSRPSSMVLEKVVGDAVSHKEGDVILRKRMTSIGRTLKTAPPPSPFSFVAESQGQRSPSKPRSPTTPQTTTTAEKRMEELLECAVCLERLKDPRTLPCEHTFCLVCLKVQLSSSLATLDSNAGVIRCPTCRREAVIPSEGGVSAFPTNVYLESLLQLVSSRRVSAPSNPQPLLPPSNGCSKCGDSGQLHLYICGHCHQVLCNNCLSAHLSELKDELISFHEKIAGVSRRLQEAEKEFSARLEQLRCQVEAEKEVRLAQVREEAERLLARVGVLEAKRLEDGRSMRDRLQCALSDFSAEAFDSANTEGKVEMFVSAENGASRVLTEASRWSEEVRFPLTFDRANFRILDPEDEEDEEEADSRGEEEEEDFEEEEGEGRRGSGVVRRESSVRAGEERRRDWEERAAVRRRGSTSRVMPTTHDELSLYYRSRSMTVPRWRWGGGSRSGSGGELSRPAGLAVAPWRGGAELYVAASDGGRVNVFARRSGTNGWKYSRTLSAPPSRERMLCPFGVAFSEARGEVYVTDKWCHCIHVYDAEGTWIRRLCKSGRSPGHLSSPEGIAASDDYIFVADTGNDRVQILNAVDGSFVGFVGSELASYKRELEKADPSPGSGYLMQPAGVALNSEESMLVVCDSGHNRIKVFDISGLYTGDYNDYNKPTCVFGSLGSQKGQLRSARGVTVDRLGFVIVADSGNARIQIFRPNGRLVRVFGSKGKESGQFGYPVAVHAGSMFEIFVSDASNHNVSFF